MGGTSAASRLVEGARAKPDRTAEGGCPYANHSYAALLGPCHVSIKEA